MVYVLFMEGIPFIYYGAEQGFKQEREPLWNAAFRHNMDLWLFLRISIAYRKQAHIWDAGLASTLHADNDTLVLTRGPFVLVLTSVGKVPGRPPGSSLTVKGLPARFAGKALANIYDNKVCVCVCF